MQFLALPVYVLSILDSIPIEGKMDFAPNMQNANGFFACRVLAVTKFAVTVTKHERKNEVVTYPFHKRLASGSYNLLGSDPYCYRRDDLKVGDLICLRFLKLESDIEFCVSVSIHDRPGGKVPPTQKWTPDEWHPYHESIMAFRDLKLYKTPVPLHLTPGGWPQDFPAFHPDIPKKDRLKRFPSDRPFSYLEFALFMR